MNGSGERERARLYWKYNIRVSAVTLAVWFVVTFGCSFFARELSGIVLFGYPLAYYMGAQGALVVFVVLVFLYARRMNDADKRFGVAEEVEP